MAKIALWLLTAALLPPLVAAAGADKPVPGAAELRAKAEKEPNRWDLWLQLSDLESEYDHPAEAEADMARVLALRPKDLDFIKKHAQLAEWAGDNPAAERSYRAIVRLDPKDYDAVFKLAQVLSWENKNEAAIHLARTYLIERPKDANALLFLAQLCGWKGDSACQRETMERYRAVAGEDKPYAESEVKRLQESGEDQAAITLAASALKKYPDDCDLYTAKAQAESSERRWRGLADSLAHARAACTDKAAVTEQARRLGAPLRSSVRGTFSYATDSDGVNIQTYGAEGRAAVSPGTFLLLGGEGGWLSASPNTSFAPDDQNSRVGLYGGWVGAERSVGDKLWLNGKAGWRTSDRRDDTVLGKAGAEYRPFDGLLLSEEFSHDIYAVSPKAVSVNIRAVDEAVHGAYRLASRTTLYADAGYSSYSDGNFQMNAAVSPRQSVIVGEKLNVDLGPSAKFATYHDPDDGTIGGYYAPKRYNQFLGILDASYAFDADDTLSAEAEVGAVRDENQSSYALSDNYSVSLSLGLYRGWMLNPRADFINDLGGVGGAGTTYHRQQYTLNVVHRF